MIKFHVNDRGEPGKCRAKGEGCPFGSESNHYATPEQARQAFERSNAGKQIPTAVKKLTRRERKELAAKQKAIKNSFEPHKYGDMQYSDLVFDREKYEAVNRTKVKKVYPKLSKAELEVVIQRRTESDRRAWERKERTEPVVDFEKNVPIRLVPVGTNLVKYDAAGEMSVVGRVESPTLDVNKGKAVGCYRDNQGNIQKIDPNAAVNIARLPPANKRTPPPWAWVREDAKALKIQRYRAKFAELHNL